MFSKTERKTGKDVSTQLEVKVNPNDMIARHRIQKRAGTCESLARFVVGQTGSAWNAGEFQTRVSHLSKTPKKTDPYL